MHIQISVLIALCALCAALPAHAQNADSARTAQDVEDLDGAVATVVIDGRSLFRVRGITSLPAEKRAALIADRIVAVASDNAFDSKYLRVVEGPRSSDIRAAEQRVMSVVDADATLEGVDRGTLALTYEERILSAIEEYRRDRTPAALRKAILRAVVATMIFIPGVWMLVRVTRRLLVLVDSRYRQRVRSVTIQSFEILHAQQIWTSVFALLRLMRNLMIAVCTYLYLNFVLGLFPWTRPTAQQLLDYLVSPLEAMGRALLTTLPDLIFLALLLIVVRYALRLLRLFFDAIRTGGVSLQGFEPEWAEPSYRLVRLAAIVLTAVVAYPYIPGSSSEAFKGISIFLGVMFSIGSSSFISNIVAGYALIYRRVFKIGDRVQIEDTVGDVMHTRLQVTHLRSLKGEEVIVPNSLILNSKVVNYSSLASTRGLILHTTISIGYEIAWRKVEAMLLMAAERTASVLREPKPFVLQKELGDFAITYELNAYCGDAQAMTTLYTALHRNILDVFNEHGVQIMTPAYEGDPAQPKIVPKEQWAEAPATPTIAA